MNGPQKLCVWLALNKVTMGVFAAELGTSGAAVSRWANGVNVPGRSWRQKIQEVTAGYIEPPDWLREPGAVPGRGMLSRTKREHEAA